MIEILAVFLTLLAATIAGFGRNILGHKGAQYITVLGVVASCAFSLYLFHDVVVLNQPRTILLGTWIHSGDFAADWSLKIDQLSAIMMVVVTLVSSVVHIYSLGYMSHDPRRGLFMAYLSLFTFMMLMLVTAENFLQMFFGWEGVGLASYLLIGFWHEKNSANKAALKAFLVNRVGDFGFALGIMAVFVIFGTISFDQIFPLVAGKESSHFTFAGISFKALDVACLLLFVGAMGKSAQLGLHTWLPDAMEGPTPVSALIHAATMVTAGVFMLVRCSPLFEYAPAALQVVTILGGLTAIVAASIGLTQFDIKRVIAYSTMSQLGYMFFAIGVSAYSAAMFHLVTHAFFKALLFLGAGSVIHALSGEQDMRRMGGIAKIIPKTYLCMWVGSLALAGIGIPGIYGFAGFYSKDIILESAFAAHSGQGLLAYWLGIIAAFMTAFYSWRLLFLTFHGKHRGDHHALEHAHESPPVMLLPLLPLVLGALLAGVLGYHYFVGEGRHEFWGNSIFTREDVLEHAHHVAEWVKLLPLLVAASGILLAYIFYVKKPSWPSRFSKSLSAVYQLFFHKYFIDEIYDRLFVKPSLWLGRVFWQVGDVQLIDGLGPNGSAYVASRMAKRTTLLQTGYVFHYALAMILGLVLLVSWYMFMKV
ncbi:MAG: NADH-quinone oxidoreductase subunit L [Alphaproteobacteria bacterium]